MDRMAGVVGRVVIAMVALSMARATSRKFAMVGYMPEWRHEGADFDRLSRHLTHLILFSAEVTPKGEIAGLDRLPRPELLAEARKAATRHGTKLLLCLGGNGRSGGFSVMVRNRKNRLAFLSSLSMLLEDYSLDGVDYNWEYPGYRMGMGYLEEKEILKDYEGLASLVKETTKVLEEQGKVVTLAYYPDTRQESLLALVGAPQHVSLLHSMSYDQGGAQHSPRELAEKTIAQARKAGLPLDKVTLGLPFYGRDSNRGDWVTYEDLVQRHELVPEDDTVMKVVMEEGVVKERMQIGFNGPETLEWKVELAWKEGLGGVMVWEVGQDCRVTPVTRGDTVHVRTCPGDQGEEKSLLYTLATTKQRLLEEEQDEKGEREEL